MRLDNVSYRVIFLIPPQKQCLSLEIKFRSSGPEKVLGMETEDRGRVELEYLIIYSQSVCVCVCVRVRVRVRVRVHVGGGGGGGGQSEHFFRSWGRGQSGTLNIFLGLVSYGLTQGWWGGGVVKESPCTC